MPRELAFSHNLTDVVTHRIERMILRDEVRPGDWLMPQPELARELGVGLSTVREAVKGLTLLGILEPQPGRGTRVSDDAPFLLRMLDLLRTRLADFDLPAIVHARRLLEVELTALAAERAAPEAVGRIEAALDDMEGVAGDDAFIDADLAFHLAVAGAADSALLGQFYHITAEFVSQINAEIAALPGLKEAGLRFQREILSAIRAGDVEAARASAAALVDRWERILRASQIAGED
jgi:GntR family transcriptional repressor for pyruvate dehydrogenase complex